MLNQSQEELTDAVTRLAYGIDDKYKVLKEMEEIRFLCLCLKEPYFPLSTLVWIFRRIALIHLSDEHVLESLFFTLVTLYYKFVSVHDQDKTTSKMEVEKPARYINGYNSDDDDNESESENENENESDGDGNSDSDNNSNDDNNDSNENFEGDNSNNYNKKQEEYLSLLRSCNFEHIFAYAMSSFTDNGEIMGACTTLVKHMSTTFRSNSFVMRLLEDAATSALTLYNSSSPIFEAAYKFLGSLEGISDESRQRMQADPSVTKKMYSVAKKENGKPNYIRGLFVAVYPNVNLLGSLNSLGCKNFLLTVMKKAQEDEETQEICAYFLAFLCAKLKGKSKAEVIDAVSKASNAFPANELILRSLDSLKRETGKHMNTKSCANKELVDHLRCCKNVFCPKCRIPQFLYACHDCREEFFCEKCAKLHSDHKTTKLFLPGRCGTVVSVSPDDDLKEPPNKKVKNEEPDKIEETNKEYKSNEIEDKRSYSIL